MIRSLAASDRLPIVNLLSYKLARSVLPTPIKLSYTLKVEVQVRDQVLCTTAAGLEVFLRHQRKLPQ